MRSLFPKEISCDFHQVVSTPLWMTLIFFADPGWSFLKSFLFLFEGVIIVLAYDVRRLLKMFLMKLSLNVSCSVTMSGVFVALAAKNTNLQLAGFHRFAWTMSIFSSFIKFLRILNCFGSFLCSISSLMVAIFSFLSFFTQSLSFSEGPQQIIGVNLRRSRDFAKRYI